MKLRSLSFALGCGVLAMVAGACKARTYADDAENKAYTVSNNGKSVYTLGLVPLKDSTKFYQFVITYDNPNGKGEFNPFEFPAPTTTAQVLPADIVDMLIGHQILSRTEDHINPGDIKGVTEAYKIKASVGDGRGTRPVVFEALEPKDVERLIRLNKAGFMEKFPNVITVVPETQNGAPSQAFLFVPGGMPQHLKDALDAIEKRLEKRVSTNDKEYDAYWEKIMARDKELLNLLTNGQPVESVATLVYDKKTAQVYNKAAIEAVRLSIGKLEDAKKAVEAAAVAEQKENAAKPQPAAQQPAAPTPVVADGKPIAGALQVFAEGAAIKSCDVVPMQRYIAALGAKASCGLSLFGRVAAFGGKEWANLIQDASRGLLQPATLGKLLQQRGKTSDGKESGVYSYEKEKDMKVLLVALAEKSGAHLDMPSMAQMLKSVEGVKLEDLQMVDRQVKVEAAKTPQTSAVPDKVAVPAVTPTPAAVVTPADATPAAGK